MYAIRTLQLSKRFGSQLAVNNLNISVPKGAIYGFLGANGAGKTTTLRLLLGLLRPSSGSIERPSSDGRPGRVGALIESPSLYPHLTGGENLDITRRLLGLPRSETDRVLDIVGLSVAKGKRTGNYSLGMRQRLALARALLGRPPLLILDEPTNGLDPEGILDMRDLLRGLPQMDETTLIVSSHLLSEIEQVASHVAIVHRGRLLVEAPLADLVGGGGSIEVGTADIRATATLLQSAGFTAETREGLLVVSGGKSFNPQPEIVARMIVEAGQSLRHIALRRPSLERLYHDQIALAA
jgi:ABC-2 type transport system ATP-binding protein